jgi:2-hydroxy-3-oxopropionate reductase
MRDVTSLSSVLSIKRVGFVGLGIMGRPMANRSSRISSDVHSRTAAAVELLKQEGATGASSPADVTSATEMVVTMLPDSSDVELVAAGRGGLFEGASPGLIIADMSTISPAVTRSLSARAAERGCEWLDAPVSGGRPALRTH